VGDGFLLPGFTPLEVFIPLEIRFLTGRAKGVAVATGNLLLTG